MSKSALIQTGASSSLGVGNAQLSGAFAKLICQEIHRNNMFPNHPRTAMNDME